MDEEKLQQYIKSAHDLMDCHDQMKETLNKMIAALTIKAYKEKNPKEERAYLVSYYGGTAANRDKYKTYEVVSPSDGKRLYYDFGQGRTFGNPKYKEVTITYCDLKKYESDKTVATLCHDLK